MKIEEIHFEDGGDLKTVRAAVVWEDCDRPAQEIYFGVPLEFGEYLSCNAHAFILGSFLPAAYAGERRIAMNQAICPCLKEGLITALGQFREWDDPPARMPRIEAEGPSIPVLPDKGRGAGCLLSGGIDSLAMLRVNRLMYPASHPNYIEHCIVVYGFDMGTGETRTSHIEAFTRTVDSLSEVTQDAKAKLIPVYTNVKSLNDDLDFWMFQFHGAVLAAVAHALAPIVRSACIAGTFDTKHLTPGGSHPLIDPNYTSADLRIEHVGLRYSRFAKTQMVAEWEAGLNNIRVCTQIFSALKASSHAMNCGKCEKCIRTMTALAAIGKLSDCRAFPANDVSKELLGGVVIQRPYQRACYEELIEPLQAQGRDDLAQAIRKLLLKYRMKRMLKGIDRRLCGGKLLAFKKAVFKKTKTPPAATQKNEQSPPTDS
jgi:hypothetical protein